MSNIRRPEDQGLDNPDAIAALHRAELERLLDHALASEPKIETPYQLITQLQEVLFQAWRRLSASQAMIDNLAHRRLESLNPFERGSIIQNDLDLNKIVIVNARKLLDAMNGHPTIARAHGLDYPHTTGEKQ